MNAVRSTDTAPSKRDQRAAAQRDRILTAAQACFTEHGFHGASIAQIADTAEMSPGLIYRYFKNKHAIILGIVERQLEWILEDLAAGNLRDSDPVDTLVDGYRGKPILRSARCTIEPALFLEIVAESSRDADVARALQHFEDSLQHAAQDWLSKVGFSENSTDDANLHARTFALRCFIDGLKVRQVREPDIDPAILRAALVHAFASLRVG